MSTADESQSVLVIRHHRRHAGRSFYDDWRLSVTFEFEEAIYRPRRWLEKLEVLEAQVINNSALPDRPLNEPLSPDHSEGHLIQLVNILRRVSQNVRNIQLSHYSSYSINILVVERSRPRVACLVSIRHVEVYRFVSYTVHFAEGAGLSNRRRTSDLLRRCNDFLRDAGLRLQGLEEHSHWSTLHLRTVTIYALRAVTYVLDIGVISFCGAHLEAFDEVYFRRCTDSYTIACDAGGRLGIALSRRRFQCLDGFLGSHAAWVFEAYDGGWKWSHADDLYLHTTPEELANVWGPVWRCEPRARGGVSRFLVENGFLVGWTRTSADPELLPGEYLCHWTDGGEEAVAAVGFPRYVNVRYLLIGAQGVERNRECRTTEIDVSAELGYKGYATETLHVESSSYYLHSLCTQVTVSFPGSAAKRGLEGSWKRRRGITARERVCTLVWTEPLEHLRVLQVSYGIEISGCTFNARRQSLRQTLTSSTMRELVTTTLSVTSAEWHSYEAVLVAADYDEVRRITVAHQRQRFAAFLRLSLDVFRQLSVFSVQRRVDALFVRAGTAHRVALLTADLGWLRLCLDDLLHFSAIVVSSSCLECTTGRLFCHEPHRRPGHGPPGCVLASAVRLNPAAPLPPGLERFGTTERVTDDMIVRVARGAELDLGPHGTLRVLAHCSVRQGRVLVVERRLAFQRLPPTVWNFFRKALGRTSQENHHEESLDPSEPSWHCVQVLVVSNRSDRRLREWLAALGWHWERD